MMRSPINIRPHSASAAISWLLLVAVAACFGCASQSKKWKFANLDPRRAVGWKSDEHKKPDPVTPTRLVATWTETTLSTQGQKPKRGFGGRLAFFGRDSEDPVRVEGNLVIYAFDETSRASHETQPTRKYIFPAEEVVRHESDSKLGPAYSFWLPWDEVGGPQRNISLIAKFEPKEGAIVLGEQTRHLLPGTMLDQPQAPQLADTLRNQAGEAVRLAAYSGQAAATVPAAHAGATQATSEVSEVKRQMSTETIALPKRLSESVQRPSETFDARTTGATPLSQLSKRNSHQSPAAAAASEPTTNGEVIQAAHTAPTAIPPSTGSATGPAAPGSLRGSLLETLPARASRDARPVPGCVR